MDAIPGWQFVGNEEFQDHCIRDSREMMYIPVAVLTMYMLLLLMLMAGKTSGIIKVKASAGGLTSGEIIVTL